MAYIIADPCVSTCDTACVEVCPVDCIHGPDNKEGEGSEAKEPGFDGKDRFMYNYHVLVKMKYPDNWQQKVKNVYL